MGREIRMVTPNYEHPKKYGGEYKPLCYGFEKDLKRFDNHIKEHGLRAALGYFAGGPNPENYMLVEYNDNDEMYYEVPECQRTWCQVFETVSEGTPYSPAFATKGELVNYLCTDGALHHKEYPEICPILTREQAERFVKAGWAPSMVVENGQIKQGIQCE